MPVRLSGIWAITAGVCFTRSKIQEVVPAEYILSTPTSLNTSDG